MQSINDFFAKLLCLPVLASEHGRDVDNMIIYVHWLMGVLFIGWLAYFAYALLRFRRARNPKADYAGVQGHASNYLEGAVVLVEAVLLIGFAVPLWANLTDKFPKAEDSTVIQVVAQQFNWNFRYAGPDGEFGKLDMRLVSADNKFGLDKNDPHSKDDVETNNEMHIPVGKPVIAYISSLDVIHSFKIIAMRVCQDAIPGLRIPNHFTATKEGKYQINCAQLCGNGHASMAGGFMTVESPAAYAAWIESKKGSAGGGSYE